MKYTNTTAKSKAEDYPSFFINDDYIFTLLESAKQSSPQEIKEILDKAERFEGLSHAEVATLIQSNDPSVWPRIFEIAGKIKDHIYGERVVLFAPLYVSDYCVNCCDYCGFRCDNKYARKKLNMDELRAEVAILEKMGHKRIALEAGEDPVNCPIDYILECMQTIYDMKFDNGEIRRANVNIAATTIENYKKLQEVGIGTYILFQESYHRESYEHYHISGPKHDYFYHTTAFDRAMEAGIDDVGAGVLFGLYDYKFEILALMLHNEHLEKEFGVGFHTISVPRLRAATGSDFSNYEHLVSDEDFIRLVALIRLAVPFTGMIISTRESEDMRKKLINLGISQMSAGSSVEVGGYAKGDDKGSQFTLSDERNARDVIYWLMQEDLIPSFCTACYRNGRTGDRFMKLAKSGNIKNVCLPNALLTLKEYTLDYADPEFTRLAEKLIEKKLPTLKNKRIYENTVKKMKDMEAGKRDLFL